MAQLQEKIFVDLDGTLIHSDLFVEGIFEYLKSNPLLIFQVIWWLLLKGRSYTKFAIAEQIDIDVASLPFRKNLIETLNIKKAQGHEIILATASPKKWADKISEYLGLFDGVLASTPDTNLKGRNKLSAIQNYSDGHAFTYAGNALADRPIWTAADACIFVNAPSADIKTAKDKGKSHTSFTDQSHSFFQFIKGMRPHQYAKNMLIFVPLITAHQYFNIEMLAATFIAFLCFCLCASGVYFLNDLLDMQADRCHPTKKERPLASGKLSIGWGIMGSILLPMISLAIAFYSLSITFGLTLLAYYLTANLYSFYLKRISTADVMALAGLYTMRIIGGATASGVILSSWLIAFSIFTFISLGYLKRYIELRPKQQNSETIKGRGYSSDDTETMFSLGTSNILAAVVILSLYINSEEVKSLYQTPEALWGLCFLMLYWGNRIWVGARRGKIHDDPIVFAISDKVSWLVAFLMGVIILVARFDLHSLLI